jgi:hypothetical protein
MYREIFVKYRIKAGIHEEITWRIKLGNIKGIKW